MSSRNAELADALLSDDCLRLCVDGGRRSQSEGALGLALFAATSMAEGPAARGSCYPISILHFLAEAAAVEWALQYLIEFVKGRVARADQQ